MRKLISLSLIYMIVALKCMCIWYFQHLKAEFNETFQILTHD